MYISIAEAVQRWKRMLRGMDGWTPRYKHGYVFCLFFIVVLIMFHLEKVFVRNEYINKK